MNADNEILLCRTFSEDGKESLCEKHARYIVWGVLYGKMNVGPKCFEHAPKPRGGHYSIELDFVATMPHAAIYEIPLLPAVNIVTRTQVYEEFFETYEMGSQADYEHGTEPTERELIEAGIDAVLELVTTLEASQWRV